MKNIMRAISLGLVCAIATSNVAHANQTDEKSPTKWEMAKNIGCTIGALPVFLVSCALLKKPRGVIIAQTMKATLEPIKYSDAATFMQVNRIVARETKSWRWRQALAGVGFATSLAIAKESFDRYDAQELEKSLQKYRMTQLEDNARYYQQVAVKQRRISEQLRDQLDTCTCRHKKKMNPNSKHFTYSNRK